MAYGDEPARITALQTPSWLKDALVEGVKVAQAAARPAVTQQEACGRTFLVNPQGERVEIKPLETDVLQFPKVGSLSGVAGVLETFANPSNTIVTVGRDGIVATVAVNADEHQSRPRLECPYFVGDNPPNDRVMGAEEFYVLLDRHKGCIGTSAINEAEEAAMRAAVRAIKGVDSKECEVKEEGAVTSFSYTKKNGVQGDGKVPSFLRIAHRRGVREFVVEHVYRLKMYAPGTKSNEITFALVHLDTDGSHEKFVRYAVDGLRELLNGFDIETNEKGETLRIPKRGPWLVVEGP